VLTIDFARDVENSIAIAIEYVENTSFVPPSVRVDVAKGLLFDEKADFERTVVTPKAHAAPTSIVAPALIWEIESHTKST
jgi:hypothetical protein